MLKGSSASTVFVLPSRKVGMQAEPHMHQAS